MNNDLSVQRPQSPAQETLVPGASSEEPRTKIRKDSISEEIKHNLYDNLYELSHKVLPRFSGHQGHIRSASEWVHNFTLKYENKHHIHMRTVDHNTSPSDIQAFLSKHQFCAVLHDGKPHFTPILKQNEKLIVFSRFNAQFLDFFEPYPSDNIYFLDDDIFKKPEAEPAQDEEAIDYQADPVSCALFAVKMAKTLLSHNAQQLNQTIYDEKNLTAYPPPIVFKQSQSNIFLKYYIPRFAQKRLEQLPSASQVQSLDQEVNRLSQEIETYRSNHFGKARMFYYNIKYFPHIKEIYKKANKGELE